MPITTAFMRQQLKERVEAMAPVKEVISTATALAKGLEQLQMEDEAHDVRAILARLWAKEKELLTEVRDEQQAERLLMMLNNTQSLKMLRAVEKTIDSRGSQYLKTLSLVEMSIDLPTSVLPHGWTCFKAELYMFILAKDKILYAAKILYAGRFGQSATKKAATTAKTPKVGRKRNYLGSNRPYIVAYRPVCWDEILSIGVQFRRVLTIIPTSSSKNSVFTHLSITILAVTSGINKAIHWFTFLYSTPPKQDNPVQSTQAMD
ncbi:hypothetical protein C8F04DRAFT_1202046 [Mycena alexandri]|uniref:Uncharacterized protein n=1 Tax=Mycena alexandri TaxID=1745969 RepID=A0AAD6RWX1_9AGAR|nr:hypothetical protein C8F04DRAFT_1202046 [Mycena alexandri]